MAGGNTRDLIVTNGCYRLKVKDGQRGLLPDLVAGLCSEAYRVQMRGLAIGSDGLAEVAETDLLSVVLPKLVTAEARQVANEYLELFAKRESTLRNVVSDWEKSGEEAFPAIPERKTGFVQV
jgi:type I restriction enzyme M protein